MCGRARCILQREEVAAAAGVSPEDFINSDKYYPVENLGPGRYTPVMCSEGSKTGSKAHRELRAMKWGLIPSFAKPNAKPDHFMMFNARSENLQERPAFKRLLHTRRCIVLCNGYYEWQQVDKKEKQPYYLYKPDQLLKFAALYDTWKNDDGEEMYSFSIITAQVSPQLKWMHVRMPVILSDEGAERWLSDALFPKVADLLVPYANPDLKWHPVDKKIGSTRFQSEECSKKVDIKHAGSNIASFFVKTEKKEPINEEPKTEPPPDVSATDKPTGFVKASDYFQELQTKATSPVREAEKCFEIGKKHLRAGNYRQAIKFLEKSERMFPLPGVDALIERARSEMASASATSPRRSTAPPSSSASTSSASSSSNNMRQRESSASEEPTRPYTAEQAQMVRKIKACKSHYEVLSVPQNADDAEIKKAYRKLALKLHPDKNSAPGAEEAFKAVGKAFTVLSDADKRAHYDKYGDSQPEMTNARGRGAAGRYYEDEVSPEEIFNMFFGGGFPRQRRAHHARRAAPPGSGAQHQQEQRPIAQLVQFLPLLMIFFLSMFSIPTQPEIPFSMQPTAQYNIQRTTQMANVAKGIPYYVDREFDRKYTTHWRDLSRVEQMVEQYHISRLTESCDNQKLKQKRMIYRARNSKEADREAAMRTALEMKMPACEQLHAFAPGRSLRLATLQPLKQAVSSGQTANQSIGRDAHATSTATAVLPKAKRRPLQQHRKLSFPDALSTFETITTATPASEVIELNQTEITKAFMESWLRKYEQDQQQYKSIVVHAEVGLREVARLTKKLPVPNEFVGAFTMKIMDSLTPHFGPYTALVRMLTGAVRQSIYCNPSDGTAPLPYFALVKAQRKVINSLKNELRKRAKRNERLVHDIRKVQETFIYFLDACAHGLVRTLLREWFSLAIIRKKNSRKYIEYFSSWFTGSPKTLIPRIFMQWKQEAMQNKIARMQKQLDADAEKLAALQKQVEELSSQRDLAQLECLAMRNDRKQAEDTTQRLSRKIQSATAYLEGSYRREGLVSQEGQLRAEAVSTLPPLVLESLLRGYHNLGFLQQLHSNVIPKGIFPATVVIATSPSMHTTKTKTTVISSTDPVQDHENAVLHKILTELTTLGVSKPLSAPAATVHNHTHAHAPNLGMASRSLSMAPAHGHGALGHIGESANHNQGGHIHRSHTVTPGHPPLAVESHTDDGDLLAQAESADEFITCFQSIVRRMELQRANVLFLPLNGSQGHMKPMTRPHAHVGQWDARLRRLVEDAVGQYEVVLHAIRSQDEHYARQTKLFSSRILENHEVTVSPQGRAVASFHNGDLGIINGVKRYSVDGINLAEMIKTASANSTSGTSKAEPVHQLPATRMIPGASNIDLEKLELVRMSDFEISGKHTRAFAALFVAHLMTEFGSLLFCPGDMSVFMHTSYLHEHALKTQLACAAAAATGGTPPPRQSTRLMLETMATAIAETEEDDEEDDAPVQQDPTIINALNNGLFTGIDSIVAAYNSWNTLATQLIDADIVHERGVSFGLELGDGALTAPGTPAAEARRSVLGKAATPPDRLVTKLASAGSMMFFRPKLLFHVEPMPQSILLATPKDHNGGSHRTSTTPPDTYHTSRIRRVPIDGVDELTRTLRTLREVGRRTTSRLQDFAVTRQQLDDFRHLQWQQVSQLASHFTSFTNVQVPIFTSKALEDDRKHVYECITMDNGTLERLFSVEDDPEAEMRKVRWILEKKKQLVRHLYAKHRPGIHYAVSVEELWHFVKVLQLPREINILPTIRDEDAIASGYEQVFSPEDLAEILLQLCNEQFLPQITPLSARVEYFATHHLPFAIRNQSIIRDIMHHPDVKKALADHGPTLRIIFRRYCAKEKDHRRGRHGHNHGIAKFMRLNDWLSFIQDYKLLRARFTVDYAVAVFRNVQEAESGQDDHLEMIYSEFCEGIVGISSSFFPDPFLPAVKKLHHFIRRFVPVSPEEVGS
ncbi:TPA: hypothetical protein N0F65_004421 [Lagenidium giganteum]|uniref:J domain-containing protein n=1 Tax=Lagenidium giganteum TaxID=4803 RepID=A0AAV2ZJG6_9STRA|nr:TPA: hypothetical protein N0F65_004421 [Lagenidium giganteum]